MFGKKMCAKLLLSARKVAVNPSRNEGRGYIYITGYIHYYDPSSPSASPSGSCLMTSHFTLVYIPVDFNIFYQNWAMIAFVTLYVQIGNNLIFKQNVKHSNLFVFFSFLILKSLYDNKSWETNEAPSFRYQSKLHKCSNR